MQCSSKQTSDHPIVSDVWFYGIVHFDCTAAVETIQ